MLTRLSVLSKCSDHGARVIAYWDKHWLSTGQTKYGIFSDVSNNSPGFLHSRQHLDRNLEC